jgi:acyl-CoA synthetase (AMP-forming)/AMP-acid ligase II
MAPVWSSRGSSDRPGREEAANVQVIFEHQANQRVSLLAEAWAGADSFALLPDRSGASEDWLKRSLSSLPDAQRTGHFAMLTSGSTGKPKLIIGSKARAEALARTLHELQHSGPVRAAVLTLPLTYTYSFVNQWVWSRVHRRELIQTHGLAHPEELAKSLSSVHDGMVCLVGVQVPLLAQYFPERRFDGIIRVHFAGGRFPQEKLGEVRRLFPNAEIFNNYGCAEAMPRLTLRRAEDSDIAANIGRPLPGVELRAGGADALLFRSPFGAVGTIEDEAGFKPITPEAWVPTGDLGKLTENSSWELLGRASDVFKRYGEKISLSSLLSTVLSAWKGQAAFYRQADPRGEEGHVLVVAPRPDDAEVRNVLRALAAKHPRTHWPLRVESLDKLPTLPNGKVDGVSLPAAPGKHEHWRQRI